MESEENKVTHGVASVEIDAEEIAENISIPLKSFVKLNKAITQLVQYKRVRAKVGRLWSGIMKQAPFVEYNELCAIYACDALMRKNGYKMIPYFVNYKTVCDEHKASADIYCFYVDLYTAAPSADALNMLQGCFRMVKPEKPITNIWGFEEDYPIVVQYIKQYLDTQHYSFE